MNILHKSLLAICLVAISVGNNHCIAAMPAPVVEAIAEVYGDGIALSTVILDYDQPIMASSVDVSDFSIPGRNIIQAYVANHASKGNQKITAGKYIVLELEQLPMTDQGLAPVHDDNDRAARKKVGQNGLEQNGATILRQTLDSTTPQAEMNQQAAALIAPDCHIYYTLYNHGGHRSTWQHAYDLQWNGFLPSENK